MNDRDHFAAAALTGLLANVQRYQNGPLVEQAWEIADFMLQERDTKPMPKRKRAEVSATLTDEEREAIEESIKLIKKEKQYGEMPKGPFMYWRYRIETLESLLERLS